MFLHESLTYQLRGKDKKTIRKNVVLKREYDGSLAVYYWVTPVLSVYTDNTITLTSGGWHTFTTKKVINEYLPRGWVLYQKDYKWYLKGPRVVYDFYDGMLLMPVIETYTVSYPEREEAV